MASGARNDRLTALERDEGALGDQVGGFPPGSRRQGAELERCDMATREATSLKGVSGLDAIAADSAGAGIPIEDLAEREFEGRTGINAADAAVEDADSDLRARIGGYQRYLDHHAKQPACEESSPISGDGRIRPRWREKARSFTSSTRTS